jgi:hypothetical protein
MQKLFGVLQSEPKFGNLENGAISQVNIAAQTLMLKVRLSF